MKASFAIAVTALAFALSACSSSTSKEAARMTPLTPEQKAKVADFSQSMSTATEVAQKAGGENGNGGNMILMSASKPGDPISKEEKSRKMSERLQGNCTFDVSKPAQEGATNFETHFIAGGDACPIAMTTTMIMKTVQGPAAADMSVKMALSYQVKDPGYAELNDNQAIEIGGEFILHADRNGVLGNGVFKGFVQNQTYGKVGVTMGMGVKGTQQSMTSTMRLAVAFPDFQAVGLAVTAGNANGQTTVKYYVNDVEVDEKEFKLVFGETNSTPGGLQNPGTLLHQLTQLQ